MERGCRRDDSGTSGPGGSTSFTHIDPLSAIPGPPLHVIRDTKRVVPVDINPGDPVLFEVGPVTGARRRGVRR